MGLGNLADDDSEDGESNEPIEVESEVVEEDSTANEIKPAESNTLIQPASDAESVAALYEKFEEMKGEILDFSTDIQEISGNNHINKSGWRKIATAFNLSVETVEESRDVVDGVVVYTVKARAVAPNGKSATGVAKCASNESNHMETLGDSENAVEKATDKAVSDSDVLKIDGKWRRLLEPKEVNDHNIYATAATRAKNRAISDCVGGGEVSAEEISKDDVL